MDSNSDSRQRRPGPVGFHAESKVSTQRHGPGNNAGGMSEAIGPLRETPTRSKELKVASPWVWAVFGALVTVLGIVLLIPIVGIAGLAVMLGAVFAGRANRTESRLRDESKRRASKQWQQ